MRPHNKYRILAKLATLSLLSLGILAVSCVSDDIGCIEDRPDYIEGNDLWMTFALNGEHTMDYQTDSRSEVSRADDNGHIDENAVADENKINFPDVLLILFDNNKNALKVFDSSEIYYFEPKDKDSQNYEFRIRINKSYFAFAGDGDINMSLMMIANLNGMGEATGSFPTANLFMKSTAAVAGLRNSFEFRTLTDDNAIWYPEAASGRYIPMSGLRHYTISRNNLDNPNGKPNDIQNPCDLTGADDMVMQRAIAKIRIIDNIAEEAKTKITRVELIDGLNTRCAYMPDFSAITGCKNWADGTTMVEKATVNNSWWKSDGSVAGRSVADKVFEIYVPELDLTSVGATSPKIKITTECELTGTKIEEVFQYPLSELISDKTIDITRNHIYEFTVNRSLSSKIPTLSYTICPWLPYTVNIPSFD